MSSHSLFSPSAFKRRELCPASYHAEKDLPDFETESSSAGTKFHEEIAGIIKDYNDLEKIDESEHSEQCMKCFEFYKSKLPVNDCECDVFVEEHLNYSYLGEELIFGTCDVLIANYTDNTGKIIDWKFGHRLVDEQADNSQGQLYALMAMKNFKLNSVEVSFFNPVIGQKTEFTFTNNDNIAGYMLNVMAKCKSEHAKYSPSEDACRYCKAQRFGTCPAIQHDIMTVQTKPADIISTLDDDKLCELYEKHTAIDNVFDTVKAEIIKRCEENGNCGNYAVKTVSGGRAIEDINGTYNKLSSFVSQNDFISCCTISVPKLEKIVCKALKTQGMAKSEKDGKEVFAEMVKELLKDKPEKKTLGKVC